MATLDSTHFEWLNALKDTKNIRLVRVSVFGMVIDFCAFEILLALGADVELSQLTSFFAGPMLALGLLANQSPPARNHTGGVARWVFHIRFVLIVLLALLLRSGVFSLLTSHWGWQPHPAILVTILIGTSIFLVNVVLFVFPFSRAGYPPADSWPVITISMVAYLLILKLVFLSHVNLIPEEAYYWNYAQHLDFGYLDHPPMVAWLIWLSTSVLGKSEVSVRLPALVCWIVAAIFIFRLARDLCGRRAAFGSVLLLAILPFYFGIGFFMTPDAPLLAAWAGCLYFLERALVGEKRGAWLWAGVCLGLGMLSKYTIALLGLGSLVFVLIDSHSRRWLLRPEPYVAAVTAAILFSPVIFWNLQNNWMSFIFQGAERWSGNYEFSLHILLGATLLILTPLGLLATVWLFLSKTSEVAPGSYQAHIRKRQHLWAVVFTLIPLSIFVIHSLVNKPKLNWTAPVWLAVLPLVASDMVKRADEAMGIWPTFSRRLWMPTLIALLLTYALSFHYVTRGMPGAGLMTPGRLFGEWREVANKVARIETLVEAQTESDVLIVGMDRNFISSELSFYHDAPYDTGGPHFFGRRSLMWAFWAPRSAAVGRNFLLIDFDRNRLLSSWLDPYFESISDISSEKLEKDGRVVGYFYWRIGYGYRG